MEENGLASYVELEDGINRLRARAAINAPIIGSTPAICARNAEKNIQVSINIMRRWLISHALFKGLGAINVAISLTIAALAGKWMSAFLTQKIFNYSNTQRKLIFGLSSSHAAATLAIILIGYKNKIIDDNILNGTIILILVTCLVASFVTERAGKKLALAPQYENVE